MVRGKNMTSQDPEKSNCALLYLIYQHLKENGYQKAANVLKKHVTKVETPEEITPLNEIYASWIKYIIDRVSDIGQHAKQEPEVDSTTLKKIKDDPSTKEEDVDLKPIDNLPQTLQAADAPENTTPAGEETVPNIERLSPGPVGNVTVETQAPVPADNPLGTDECSEFQDKVPTTQTPSKVTQTLAHTKTPVTPAAPRKAESSDSEQEKPTPKAVSGTPLTQASVLTPAIVALKTPAAGEKAQSSESDSDSDTEKDISVKKPAATARSKHVGRALTQAAAVKSSPVTTSMPADSSESDSEDVESLVEKSALIFKAVNPSIVTSGQAKTTPKTSAAGKKAQSFDSDSSDSEEEAPKKVTKKSKLKATALDSVKTAEPVKSIRPAVTPLKPAESSGSDSSEDSVPLTQTPAKVTQTSAPTKTPVTPAAPKKAESSDSDASDSEQEVTVKKSALTSKAGSVKAAKETPVNPSGVTPSQVKTAPKKPAAEKKVQSSESDGSDSEEAPKKATKKTKLKATALDSVKTAEPVKSIRPAVTPSKPAESSGSDSSEDSVPLTQTPAKVTQTSAPTKTPVTPAAPRKAESSDSDASDSEQEVTVKTVTKKTKLKATALDSGKTAEPVKSIRPAVTPSKPAESSGSDSSEDSVPLTQTPAKVTQTSAPTKTPVTPAAPRKAESSDSDASDSEQEVTVKKSALTSKAGSVKAAKETLVNPSGVTPSQVKTAPKKPAAGKKVQSSDSDGSDSEETSVKKTDSSSVPSKAKVPSKTTPKTPVIDVKGESEGLPDSEDDFIAPVPHTPCLAKAPPRDTSAAKMPDSSDSNKSTEEDTSAQKVKTKTKRRVTAAVKAVAVKTAEPVKSIRPVVTPSKPAESSGSDSSEDSVPLTQNANSSPIAEQLGPVQTKDDGKDSSDIVCEEILLYPDFTPSENVDTEAPTSEEIDVTQIKATPPASEAEGAEKEEDESTSVTPTTEVTADNSGDDPVNTSGALHEDTPPSSVPESAKEYEDPESLQTLKTDLKELKAEEHVVTSTTTDDKSDTPEPPVEASATVAVVETAVEEEAIKDVEPLIPSSASEDLEPAQVTIEPVVEKVLTEEPTTKTPKRKRKRKTKTPDLILSLKKMKMEKTVEAVQENGQPPIERQDDSSVDAYPATESSFTTLVLSAKSLKIRKKRKKSKRGPPEDDKTQDVVPKKQKAEQNKKNTEVVSNVKEILKATKKKRPIPPFPESEEIETPKNKKRKVSENVAVMENITAAVEKKKKKKKKKKTAKAEDFVKDSDISTPQTSLPEETSQKKKKKKRKEKNEKLFNALKTPHKAWTGPVNKTTAKDSPGKKKKLSQEK